MKFASVSSLDFSCKYRQALLIVGVEIDSLFFFTLQNAYSTALGDDEQFIIKLV